MSVISSFHSVDVFNAASSKPCDGQRLVVIHYKSRKDESGKILPKFPSLCVSIPFIRLTVSAGSENNAAISAINAATISLWESIQDAVIRQLIDQRRGKENPSTSAKLNISDDEISLASCAQFAAATGNGKLSAESINQWFDSYLTEPLMAALLASDSTRTDDQITAILTNYRLALSKLAAVQPGLNAATQQQLRKAIAHSPEGDQMAERLITKLDAMNKSNEILLDAL